MTTFQTLTQADRDHLDRLVAECQAIARREGWTGPWTLQVGDLDFIINARRGTTRTADGDQAKLTAAEGDYLGISRVYGAHVEWDDTE